MPLLQLQDVTVRFGDRVVLDAVNLTVDAGARVGLIGESGSGKSLLALAILGLLPTGANVSGSIRFDGRELTTLGDRQLSAIRGNRIGIVFQEPLSALDPTMRIGLQIAEPLRLHRGVSRRAALRRAVELAAEVGLPEPESIIRAFPHQLSGGQRQRACIAAAVAAGPALLIADEPTTALDVTVQARVLALLHRLTADSDTAVLFITHDLAVLAQVAATAVVLRRGRVVEHGQLDALLHNPAASYTTDLIRAAREMQL